MIAVVAKNTSSDEDLTMTIIEEVFFCIIAKILFIMCPKSNQAHFMAMNCRNTFLWRDILICLDFSAGALRNATKISKIPTNLHIVRVTLKKSASNIKM